MHIGTGRNSKELATKIQAANEKIEEIVSQQERIENEQDLERIELQVQALTRELCDLIVALKLQRTLDENEAFRASARELSHRIRKTLINKGRVIVQVKFSGGTTLPLEATYWARKGTAGKRGKGMYPELYLLGIHDHCTPLLASHIAQCAAALCSLEEARHMMESRGCSLDIKTVRSVTKRFHFWGRKVATVLFLRETG